MFQECFALRRQTVIHHRKGALTILVSILDNHQALISVGKTVVRGIGDELMHEKADRDGEINVNTFLRRVDHHSNTALCELLGGVNLAAQLEEKF